MFSLQAVEFLFASLVVLVTLWNLAAALVAVFHLVRVGRLVAACLAVVGGLGQAAALALLGTYWFVYAVAHGPKSAESDIEAMLLTGLPFAILSLGVNMLLRVLRRKGKAGATSGA